MLLVLPVFTEMDALSKSKRNPLGVGVRKRFAVSKKMGEARKTGKDCHNNAPVKIDAMLCLRWETIELLIE